MLNYTDANNTLSKMIRLPFNKILLILPKAIAFKGCSYKNILVYEENFNHCKDVNWNELIDKDKPDRAYKLLMVNYDSKGTDFYGFYLYLWDELTIEESLKLSLKVNKGIGFSEISDETKNEMKTGFYILINFILYLIYVKDYKLNNQHSNLKTLLKQAKTKKNRKNIQNQIKTTCPFPCDFFEVGESKIIISGNSQKNKQEVSSKKSPSKMFWVRGHWREYRDERYKMENRLQWIKPFLKGSENETLSNPVYEVQ